MSILGEDLKDLITQCWWVSHHFIMGLLMERIVVNRQMEPTIVRVQVPLDPVNFSPNQRRF